MQRTPEELGAWLVARLTHDDRARGEWRSIFEAAWRRLLGEKLSALFPKEKIEALVTAHLADEARLTAIVTFEVRASMRPAIEQMRADPKKLGRWVPEGAKGKLLALVAEKQMVHPEWVRSIFREPAIEAIVSDTLYRALIDFSTIVPRLIQSLPLGGFTRIGGIGTRIVEEIEKRLEPEIRRFLDKGTRRALEGASKFAVDHLDDKLSIEFRKNMVTFFLEQDARFHVHALTDPRLDQIESIARDIAAHVAKSEETKERIARTISEIAEKSGEKTLGEVLRELGGIEEPPFDQWAEATFELVARVLSTPQVTLYLGSIALELLEQVT